MPVISIGAIIADDLRKNYLPTVYSIAQMKKEDLVPKALIFALVQKAKGKDTTQLLKYDVVNRIDKEHDKPLPTPKYIIDALIATRHRFRQYAQWFIDDGANIRPLMKSTLEELVANLYIEVGTAETSATHHTTHV